MQIHKLDTRKGWKVTRTWVGKVNSSCETSRDSLFLIVQSKVRRANVRLRSKCPNVFVGFNFVRLCSAIEVNHSIKFDCVR